MQIIYNIFNDYVIKRIVDARSLQHFLFTRKIIFIVCFVSGIKIIGGTGEEEEGDFGIFIKRILFGGLADDGKTNTPMTHQGITDNML